MKSGIWCSLVSRLLNCLFEPWLPASTMADFQIWGKSPEREYVMSRSRRHHGAGTAQVFQRSVCTTLISNHWSVRRGTGRTLLPSGGHIGLWLSLGTESSLCKIKLWRHHSDAVNIRSEEGGFFKPESNYNCSWKLACISVTRLSSSCNWSNTFFY